jgi:Pregnancy-associated plasma protein-A
MRRGCGDFPEAAAQYQPAKSRQRPIATRAAKANSNGVCGFHLQPVPIEFAIGVRSVSQVADGMYPAAQTSEDLMANETVGREDERPNGEHEFVRCRAFEEHLRLLRTDPEYRWRRREIGREIDAWLRRYGDVGLRTGLIRIPVVVHVVYNTPAQNISDAQIQSQIVALNEDFRRLNTDAANTPAAFAGVAADARLEFALAVRDPNCAPTTGITRTSTTVTGWTYPGEGMKSAPAGADQWDPQQYLNVWIVNYADGTLGYGTFPGMPANIQGVVVDFRAFGTTGTLTPGAHLGRTTTHEIGHWLDLFHIWGDDNGACTGTDLVADTPNQADASPFSGTTCRVFPSLSCSNGPNGDMFQNYMDYSGDQCMNLFTAGQVVRMDATLHTARSTILASPGLVTPTGVPGPDLWSKDTSDDMGVEPNPSSQPMYISDDIWVRRQNDGLLNQDHQNPEYRTAGGLPNYVYIRVRNRACSGTQSGTVRLYWAKASSGLSWPAPFDGSVTTPALMGSPIGSASVSVPGGDDQILVFPWMPPNPANYASFGADQSHFCLLSRIETSSVTPFGMTTPEGSNLYANVQNNNNIVWKNITIVDEVPGTGRLTAFTVGNFGGEPQVLRLVFSVPDERPTVLDWGRVFVEVPYVLAVRLRDPRSKGVQWLSDTTFVLTSERATVEGPELRTGDIFTLTVRFASAGDPAFGARVLMLDVQQFDGQQLVGGVRFAVRTQAAAVDWGGYGQEAPPDGGNWVAGTGQLGCLSC